MRNGLLRHPRVAIKNGRDRYLGCGTILLKSQGCQPLPSQGSSAAERSPHDFWLCEPAESVTGGDRGWLQSHEILLQGPRTDLLTDGITGSELQCWGCSWRGDSVIQGRTELSGCRTRAGGAAFSQTEELAEALFLSLAFPLPGVQMQASAISVCPSS